MVDLKNLKKRNLFVNKCIQNVHVEKRNIPFFGVVIVKGVFRSYIHHDGYEQLQSKT